MTSMSSGSHSSFNSDEESSEEEKKREKSPDRATSHVSSVFIADNRTDKNDADESFEPEQTQFVLRKMDGKRNLSLKEKSKFSRVVTALVGDRVVL